MQLEKSAFELLYPELVSTHRVIDAGESFDLRPGELAILFRGLGHSENDRRILGTDDGIAGPSRVTCLEKSEFRVFDLSQGPNTVDSYLHLNPRLIHVIPILLDSGISPRRIRDIFHSLAAAPSDFQRAEVLAQIFPSTESVISEKLQPRSDHGNPSPVIRRPFFSDRIFTLGLFAVVGTGTFVTLISQPLIFASTDVKVTPRYFWLVLASISVGTVLVKIFVFFNRSQQLTSSLSEKFSGIVDHMVAKPTKGITIGRLISLLMFTRQTLNFRDLMLPSLFFTCVFAAISLLVFVPDSAVFLSIWLLVIIVVFVSLDEFSRRRYGTASKHRSGIDNAEFSHLSMQDLSRWLETREAHSNAANVFYSFQNQLSVLSMVAFFAFRFGASSNFYLEVLLFQVLLLSLLQISKRIPVLRAVRHELAQADVPQGMVASREGFDFSKSWDGEGYLIEKLSAGGIVFSDPFYIRKGGLYVFSFPGLETAEEFFQSLCGIKDTDVFSVVSGKSAWSSNVEFSSNIAFFSPDLKLSFLRVKDNIISRASQSDVFDEVVNFLEIPARLASLGLSLESNLGQDTFMPFSLKVRILLARLFLESDRKIWMFSRLEACFGKELWEQVRAYALRSGKVILCSSQDKFFIRSTDTILYFDDSYSLHQGVYSTLATELGASFLKRFNYA
jgi:hypothetical protein